MKTVKFRLHLTKDFGHWNFVTSSLSMLIFNHFFVN